MNQYPLDEEGIHKIFNQFLEHNSAQINTIEKLSEYLREAIEHLDNPHISWLKEVQTFINSLHKRRVDFENFRFDQKNGHKLEEVSPYKPNVTLVPGQQVASQDEGVLNKLEESFGDVMTEEELARHFGESLPKKSTKNKSIDKMTLEEIEEWEAAQNNSNDIYKVAARMKNIARMAVQGNLTPQGEMIVNTFAHMIKTFYDFSSGLPDREIKIKLTALIEQQEKLPGNLISALWAGVKEAKD